jgi:CBS domain containing-hemolysin-like protein
MLIFNILFRPLIYFLTACANATLAMFGIRSAPESERTHSLAELSMLVSHSGERGVLDKVEEEMLQSVFSFSDTVAREIMTPRTDLITIPIDASIEEVVQIVVSSGYSRFPVIGDTVDDVLGVVMSRDLLPYVHNLKSSPEREFSLKRIMREPYFVPGTKQISDLLNEFKRRKLHIAIVLDEHGGVDGVVTLEDVIEEIVGDIFDESDVVERDIIVEDDGKVVVDGGVLVADINDRLEFSIPEGDYDTIAGFIYTSLGRLPRPGDEIVIRDSGNLEVNGKLIEEASETSAESSPLAQITVEKVTGRRIERVKLQKLLSESLLSPEASEETKEARS